jgi:hypothetical protein
MKAFRKLPVEIQAVRWTGDNSKELQKFAATNFDSVSRPAQVFDRLHETWIAVVDGDWIIKGIQGEFYPIKHDVLMATYEGLCFLCGHPDNEHIRAAVGACRCGCDGPLDGP